MALSDIPHLPIQEVLPALLEALAGNRSAVLSAEAGSGKTTIVPLALLDQPWLSGRKIILLKPRRLAARAAAMRMSELLGEEIGAIIGYRVRFDSRVSRATRIEVVTEGILIRMIQDDPELDGAGLVIFDEFHERSLQADLALALCLDARQLQHDLKILIMSATLDSGGVAGMLDGAPVISGQGRCFPVHIDYLQRPSTQPLLQRTAAGIRNALAEQEGDMLAFLPGAGEISRLHSIFTARDDLSCLPLYGALPWEKQHLIFQRKSGGRRLMLAPSIAETSLTIEGIRTVVDCGLRKSPLFDPSSGLTNLKVIPVTKASADQRAGRAGRLGPGHCYRLWTMAEHYSRPDFHPPEISNADLAPLVLELALWGVADPTRLSWLDPPPVRGSLTRPGNYCLPSMPSIPGGQSPHWADRLPPFPCIPGWQ